MSVHPIPEVEIQAQQAPAEVPVSLLQLLHFTLGDNERTANAKQLMATGSKAFSYVILSVGLVLAATTTLAILVIHLAGLGSAIGIGIAAAGTGTAWLARSLCVRRKAKKVRSGRPRPVAADLLQNQPQ